MMKSLSTALLFTVAAPAFAQTAGAPAADAKADPNRVICERYEETGSRLGAQKVCRTAREWEAQRAAKAPKKTERNAGTSNGN